MLEGKLSHAHRHERASVSCAAYCDDVAGVAGGGVDKKPTPTCTDTPCNTPFGGFSSGPNRWMTCTIRPHEQRRELLHLMQLPLELAATGVGEPGVAPLPRARRHSWDGDKRVALCLFRCPMPDGRWPMADGRCEVCGGVRRPGSSSAKLDAHLGCDGRDHSYEVPGPLGHGLPVVLDREQTRADERPGAGSGPGRVIGSCCGAKHVAG